MTMHQTLTDILNLTSLYLLNHGDKPSEQLHYRAKDERIVCIRFDRAS